MILLAGCSYIPFTNDCERLPKEVSYNGFTLHFGRQADYVNYRQRVDLDLRQRRYIDYFWDTCGGKTSVVIVFEYVYELNEYGMYINVPIYNTVYASMMGIGTADIRKAEGVRIDE